MVSQPAIIPACSSWSLRTDFCKTCISLDSPVTALLLRQLQLYLPAAVVQQLSSQGTRAPRSCSAFSAAHPPLLVGVAEQDAAILAPFLPGWCLCGCMLFPSLSCNDCTTVVLSRVGVYERNAELCRRVPL